MNRGSRAVLANSAASRCRASGQRQAGHRQVIISRAERKLAVDAHRQIAPSTGGSAISISKVSPGWKLIGRFGTAERHRSSRCRALR